MEDGIDGYTADNPVVTNGGTITNVHTPGKTSITIFKKWEDNNDQDNRGNY